MRNEKNERRSKWFSSSLGRMVVSVSFKKACQTSIRDGYQHQLHFFCCLSEIELTNKNITVDFYLNIAYCSSLTLIFLHYQNYYFILKKGGLFHITGFILYCHLFAKKYSHTHANKIQHKTGKYKYLN